MLRNTLAVLGLTLLATLPAQAALCSGSGEGLSYGFSLGIGSNITEDDQNQIDLVNLRRLGVDATSVERWGGCLRAFVRKPTGGEEMQYFEPGTYKRVQ
ncbi:MAG: hypothetical protein KKF33_00715 [Alphaproteobacteria bacterium]|jgi:hypothetical protein|nr:hypothetical protein [Alphaproteobacteria bacterium]